MPPSPVLWANPPMAAPLFRERTAFLDSEPKLIEDTFSMEMEYGLVQSLPPTSARGGSAGSSTGAMECTRCSWLES